MTEKTCGGCWWWVHNALATVGICASAATKHRDVPCGFSCPAWAARPGVVNAVSGWLPGKDAPKDGSVFEGITAFTKEPWLHVPAGTPVVIELTWVAEWERFAAIGGSGSLLGSPIFWRPIPTTPEVER